VGCIRSWDHHQNEWQYPVIIDNMMNLELLFWAFRETGDSTYYKIAISHADKTMKNHFRKDHSCFHVVDYDTLTGKVIKKNTHQGYSDSSSWARGQAWALYGFTLVYNYTRDKKYLEQAKDIEAFIFSNKYMPDDLIPYWDFDDPAIPNSPRDVSAAAIMCSALFDMGKTGDEKAEMYTDKAEKILNTLIDNYIIPKKAVKNNNYFILDHSTGNYPAHSEIDVPIIYADYYFMESLLKEMKLRGMINKKRK
jgi:rhamnogalacturonyl hydrolase YesR